MSFLPGELTAEVVISLTTDDIPEVDKYFYVYITEATASETVIIGYPSEATVTIEDDGERRF